MNYFLYFMAIITGIEVLGRIKWLACDKWPEHTRGTIVWSTFINFSILVWSIHLLVM